MGPTWGRQDPGGPHVGVTWNLLSGQRMRTVCITLWAHPKISVFTSFNFTSLSGGRVVASYLYESTICCPQSQEVIHLQSPGQHQSQESIMGSSVYHQKANDIIDHIHVWGIDRTRDTMTAYYTPRFNEFERGNTGFTSSVRMSVRPSVRLWTKPCSFCIFHNTSRIHFIFAHLIKQLQQMCSV